MHYEYISHSVAETQKLAEQLAKEVHAGKIITLSGELGAGKTTFVQGFAKGLGIPNRVVSPTFMIVRNYTITNSQLQIENFYHIDLYRIHSEKELEGLGFSEILADKQGVVIVEWPERMGSLLPEKRWDMKIESLEENERKIRIYKL